MEIAQSEVGEHESAYFLPKLAEKLVKHVNWIPLWSNVYRDRYKYGKLPASSASVECEFKNVKKKFLAGKQVPMRADVFTHGYINDYIKGRTNIFIAQDIENAQFADSKSSEESNVSSPRKKSRSEDSLFEENMLGNTLMELQLNRVMEVNPTKTTSNVENSLSETIATDIDRLNSKVMASDSSLGNDVNVERYSYSEGTGKHLRNYYTSILY